LIGARSRPAETPELMRMGPLGFVGAGVGVMVGLVAGPAVSEVSGPLPAGARLSVPGSGGASERLVGAVVMRMMEIGGAAAGAGLEGMAAEVASAWTRGGGGCGGRGGGGGVSDIVGTRRGRTSGWSSGSAMIAATRIACAANEMSAGQRLRERRSGVDSTSEAWKSGGWGRDSWSMVAPRMGSMCALSEECVVLG